MPVAADDAEMNRAMERARAEVSTFVDGLQNPKPGDRDFAFKAPVKQGDQVEHFWLDNVHHEASHLVGAIGNDPQAVRNVKVGDQLKVRIAEISDWMFVRDGVLVGGYTIRVMLGRLGEEERKEMLASLPFRIK